MKTLLTASAAALLCAACSSGPEPLPETFEDWVAGLGPTSSEFLPYHADFQFRMEMDMAALLGSMEEVQVEHHGDSGYGGLLCYDFGGGYDMAAPDLLRFEGTMRVDLGALADADLEGPIEIGLLVVSDATTVYVEPRWRSGWLRAALAREGQGFSEMVFTARVATVERLLEAMGSMMDAQGAEFLDGRSFLEMMRDNLVLDAWIHSLAEYAEIRSFEIVDDEVRVGFGLNEEYWEMVDGMSPGAPQDFITDADYLLVADRRSGIPRLMTMHMEGMMTMTMHMDVAQRSPEDWDAEHFRYHLPEGRHLFPVDQFLDLARTVLSQGVAAPDDGDFEF